MKKQQLLAMAISAISAGILISCAKPTNTDDELPQTSSVEESPVTTTTPNDAITDVDNIVVNVDSKVIGADLINLSTQDSHAYLTHVLNEQILPAYADATKQIEAFNAMADKYCQAGIIEGAGVSGDELQALKDQWLEVATTWATTQAINFGPATDSMSDLYINYYPDERGMVHQGVVDLIDNNPELTPSQLAQESAVVQGIPGLEEVLYANDSLDISQCRYVMSASEALNERIKTINDAWQDTPEVLLGIDAQSTQDSAIDLGMNRWVNSLLALVETTKSVSIDKPLGLTGHRKGHLPAAAAGQSRAIISAKVDALTNALTDPELVKILNNNGHEDLTNRISTVLTQTEALLNQMPVDIADATPSQQQELYDNLTKLTQLIKRELMPTLAVQVGFNSTDGD